MPALNEWFSVHFDNEAVHIEATPPGGTAWADDIQWERIIRVCFKAGDLFDSDEIYLFTDERPESYLIPTEASGGLALWTEIIERKLFDADLAIKAATATNEIFCSPPGE